MSKVEIAHGAVVDPDDGTIELPIGNVILRFTFEEWSTFFTMIDDVNTVFQMNSVESVGQCPACNTIISVVQYEEPDEQEIN